MSDEKYLVREQLQPIDYSTLSKSQFVYVKKLEARVAELERLLRALNGE